MTQKAKQALARPRTTATVGNNAQWLPHLSSYTDKSILNFKTNDELEKAIDLLWTDELRTLPHDTPDGKSIVVPAEAVEYFTRAGLQFKEKKLRSISDLTPEEIVKVRK